LYGPRTHLVVRPHHQRVAPIAGDVDVALVREAHGDGERTGDITSAVDARTHHSGSWTAGRCPHDKGPDTIARRARRTVVDRGAVVLQQNIAADAFISGVGARAAAEDTNDQQANEKLHAPPREDVGS